MNLTLLWKKFITFGETMSSLFSLHVEHFSIFIEDDACKPEYDELGSIRGWNEVTVMELTLAGSVEERRLPP